MAATVSAEYGSENGRTAAVENEKCDLSQAHARITNRCDYDVYLWSVLKSIGCPTDSAFKLKTGESYAENFVKPTESDAPDDTGVSIKISKTEECKGNDITQFEYFIKEEGDYAGNYFDVSYVDCGSMKCPAREDGYYLVAGNQTGKFKATAHNTKWPILSCSDATECDTMSYVLPDDVQTKMCDIESNVEFYLCGSEAPSDNDDSAPKPESSSEYSAPSYASSTNPAEYPTAVPTSASSSGSEEVAYSADIEVAAAAVTPTPQKQDEYGNEKLTKTKVVYVTAYEYVNEKRHAHDHARRHAAFHA
ncbi:hypothetical protein DDE82_006203 [Stemphylium lycopersici]|uniref:Uncharacterized protein n=1 Tax=Stemphylium lycopersici TaxID=183478 RepID=A0A364N1S7_STELY|nr:hypothetical protein DDE82_006203 [Stemphylium lycopersici]RAR09449.1 hypothetical protein DDE83_005521 [Stemphylium lycopersici]